MSIFFLLLISSCTFNTIRENREEDKKEAEKVTQQFFTLVKENNKKELYKLFSDKFFQVTNKNQLNSIIDWGQKEGDSIIGYSIVSWKTTIVKGTNPKSDYLLIYNVKRKKISTEEIFSLQKENDTIKILGYRLNLDLKK